MWSSKNLDSLNGGGWWVFIASNHFLVVGWLCCLQAHQTVRWCTGHRIVHCPVHATSAACWGLGRLTIEVLCPLAAPDSPVAHRIVRCVLTSQLWLLTSALCTVHCSQQSTVGRNWPLIRWLTGHVRCTPDCPVNYSGATPRETRERPVREVLGLVSGAPLATQMLVFAPNFVEFPSQFFCWFMLNFMHLR
jgi:hypothetical protein